MQKYLIQNSFNLKGKVFLLSLFLISCFCSSLFAVYDPIALYLTWQRSPETTMTIHWITHPNRQESVVEYRKPNESQWRESTGSVKQLPNDNPYFIHTVELTNLEPNQNYFFRTGSDALEYKFRTMPADLDGTIRFIVGGDMYHDGLDLLHQTNRQAAKTDPMFALVGGDIAYATGKNFSVLPNWMQKWIDNLFGQKIDRWMEWLIAWKKDMVTPDGRLIPMLPAIGNHDTSGQFDQTPENAPFFYSLFSMPGSQGYNVLDFGSYMSIFILDSGHTHPIAGLQESWLEHALKERTDVPNKFAIYHVPAYPSYRKVNNKYSLLIRNHWVPLFEHYGLSAAFENHDHAYKRTHPILNGRVDASSGVLYLGDGGWGIKKLRKPKTSYQRWYLAKTASLRHFIMVTINQDQRYFTAITSEGLILDEIQR